MEGAGDPHTQGGVAPGLGEGPRWPLGHGTWAVAGLPLPAFQLIPLAVPSIFQLKLLPDKTARLLLTGKGSKLKVQPSPDPDPYPDPVLGAGFKDCVEGNVGEGGPCSTDK